MVRDLALCCLGGKEAVVLHASIGTETLISVSGSSGALERRGCRSRGRSSSRSRSRSRSLLPLPLLRRRSRSSSCPPLPLPLLSALFCTRGARLLLWRGYWRDGGGLPRYVDWGLLEALGGLLRDLRHWVLRDLRPWVLRDRLRRRVLLRDLRLLEVGWRLVDLPLSDLACGVRDRGRCRLLRLGMGDGDGEARRRYRSGDPCLCRRWE